MWEKKKNNQLARELLEALAIKDNGENCVSAPSVALHHKEEAFLRGATVSGQG